MWLSWVSSNSNFFPHASHSNTCRLVPSSLISFTGVTFRDKSMPGSLIFSQWGSSEPLWLFPLCILRPLSDLKAFPQISHLNVSSPFCGRSAARSCRSTSTSKDTGAGFCFLCRNASFRLAFLLSVDGLDFFLVLMSWCLVWLILLLINADADWCFCRLMLMLWPLAVTPGVTQ